MKNRVLILFAHPKIHESRINNALIKDIQDIEGITFHNLYNQYPDFNIDVKHEQQLLLDHDIYIWHHPFYWYSAPAIIKQWFDLVLERGFAYGSKGNALEGKRAFNTLTAGASRTSYSNEGHNNFTVNQLLRPFEQSAYLCKMIYLPPFVIHETHLLSENEIQEKANIYKNFLKSLRDGHLNNAELESQEYINDILESDE